MASRFVPLVFASLVALSAAAADRGVIAGCDLRIDAPVDGNLAAAGCSVTVDTAVGGDLRVAAASVELAPGARVAGKLHAAGAQVTVKGTVEGDLKVAAGSVVIDGRVAGDASVAAGRLALGPNARIDGRLRFRGGTLEQDSGARVAEGVDTRPRHSHRVHGPFGHSGGGWYWTVSLMLLAGAFAALLPGVSGRMAQELRARPAMAVLFGFIAFACIPVAAVLVMITIIGIPIGLLALLGYALLLLAGYVTASVVTGGLVLDRLKAENAGRLAWRAGAAVLAMLALALLGRVPVLGHFVAFAALIVGVGAIVATVLHRQAPAPAA